MRLVIDASETLKWYLKDRADEPNVDTSLGILDGVLAGDHTMVQPPHWLAEVIAVLARRQPDAVRPALETLQEMTRDTYEDQSLYLRAADLSSRLGHHLFDTFYHALALEQGATLVTADERYYRVALQEGAIQRLGDFRNS